MRMHIYFILLFLSILLLDLIWCTSYIRLPKLIKPWRFFLQKYNLFFLSNDNGCMLRLLLAMSKFREWKKVKTNGHCFAWLLTRMEKSAIMINIIVLCPVCISFALRLRKGTAYAGIKWDWSIYVWLHCEITKLASESCQIINCPVVFHSPHFHMLSVRFFLKQFKFELCVTTINSDVSHIYSAN